jgi:hypothetical protein
MMYMPAERKAGAMVRRMTLILKPHLEKGSLCSSSRPTYPVLVVSDAENLLHGGGMLTGRLHQTSKSHEETVEAPFRPEE